MGNSCIFLIMKFNGALIPVRLNFLIFSRSPNVIRALSCFTYNCFFLLIDTSLISGDVRLVGGVLPSRGYLEIFHDGFWRRVCMSEVIYSTIKTAAAACHQLGYSGLLEASSRIEKSDNSSLDIQCTPNVEFVRSCNRSNATCNEHVFVSCRTTIVFPFDFRLVGGSVSSQGLLEVRLGDEWRAACSSSVFEQYPSLVSNASCRHLGFSKGTSAKNSLAGRSSCVFFGVWINADQFRTSIFTSGRKLRRT